MSRLRHAVETPLRVLIVELQGRGGFWHFAHALSAALTKMGSVTALATTPEHEDVGEHTTPIFILGRPTASTRVPALISRPWHHGMKLLQLLRVLREFRPDIIHLQGPIGRLDFLYFRWLKGFGARVVYTAHNPRPRDGRGRWSALARYRAADAVIVLSQVGVTHLIADGVDSSTVFFVPHGNYVQISDHAAMSPNGRKGALGLPETACVVLFFGQIAPYKGLDLLLEAFARVREHKPDAYLVIAGRVVGNFAPYRELVIRLGLTEAVILKPEYIPLPELPTYFLAADVVAFPYRRSYQSGVLHLAYGFARPVVVTETSDLGPDVAADGAGLVTRFDPDDFAAAVLLLLSDPARAGQMGRTARHAAETKYSWRHVAAQTMDIYRWASGLSVRSTPEGGGGEPGPEHALEHAISANVSDREAEGN